MHDAGIGFRSGVRDVRGRYWKDRLGAARAARIKGWSVDEVSSRIKFSARQIEALENEQWADLPSGVSLRGLIRNYARLLGADSQAIVESLDPKERVTGPVKLSRRAAFRAFHSPVGADDERSSSASWGWLIAIVLVLAAGVAMRSGRGWLPQHWLAFDWLPSCPSKPGFPDARILSALPGCAASRCGSRAASATRSVDVKWGERVVTIGGSAPVVVQSMTNTDTADAIATAIQVKELALAGSEMVRITVNTPEAAREVAAIREQLDRMGVDVPLVGDFHYNGHKLLTQFPECAQALSSTGSIRATWVAASAATTISRR